MTTTLDEDRIRTRSWSGKGVQLDQVVAELHHLERELTDHDAGEGEHPHPRNSVLNIVVVTGEHKRAAGCDRVVARLAASHPLRAILIHVTEGDGTEPLDAEITADAHQLVSGFPIQRTQVLLHVRGAASRHLGSLVEPLLVPDVTTFVWWWGRGHLDQSAMHDAIAFSNVLVVDTEHVQHPVEALLELVALAADGARRIKIADFRFERLRPWREAVAQFFAPASRRPMLTAVRSLTIEAAGDGPANRAGAALLAGWVAAALGWSPVRIDEGDGDATTGSTDAPGGGSVKVVLRSAAGDRLPEGVREGTVVALTIAGGEGRHRFSLDVRLDPASAGHADLTIELAGRELRQQLTLPGSGEDELLTHVLLAVRNDPVLPGVLAAAGPMLEALR